MLPLSIENNSDGSESGSDSETTNHSRISNKSKCIRDQFRAWNFIILFRPICLKRKRKRFLLMNRNFCLPSTSELVWVIIGLRLSPPSLYSATFSLVTVPPPGIGPLISVPIVCFVQSQKRTVYTMIPWFPDAKWAPVLCGLTDHPDFLQ